MKVLVGFIGDGRQGGIDKYLLNFWESVVSDEVQIDFLTSEKDGELLEKLDQHNSHLYRISTLKHPIKQYLTVKRLLISESYDVLYLNVSTAINCASAFAGWRVGVKRRAFHSHSSGNDCENVLKRKLLDLCHGLCKSFFYRLGNDYYACSKKAAEWLFPRRLVKAGKVNIVYNAVDIDQFTYRPLLREEMRNKLGIKEELVLGHVGNFVYQKNHRFLIEIFKNLVAINSNVKLLLIGKGPQYEEIVKYVNTCGISDKVLFLGWRKDVADLYQAMDIFVLPSNFEGLPIVGVEAQSVGLKCIFSDKITDEVKLTKEAEFLPINSKEALKIWTDHILNGKDYDREKNIIIQNKELYDLSQQKEAYLKVVAQK